MKLRVLLLLAFMLPGCEACQENTERVPVTLSLECEQTEWVKRGDVRWRCVDRQTGAVCYELGGGAACLPGLADKVPERRP